MFPLPLSREPAQFEARGGVRLANASLPVLSTPAIKN